MNQPDFTICSPLLSPPSPLPINYVFMYRLQTLPLPILMDGQMKEAGGGGIPSRLRFPSSTYSFCRNLASPFALSHPPLTPSLTSLTIMSSSSLTLPCRLALHRNGRKRERGKGCDCPPFHLPRLQEQIIGFCLRIEGNCSLHSVPSKCMILTPCSLLALK